MPRSFLVRRYKQQHARVLMEEERRYKKEGEENSECCPRQKLVFDSAKEKFSSSAADEVFGQTNKAPSRRKRSRGRPRLPRVSRFRRFSLPISEALLTASKIVRRRRKQKKRREVALDQKPTRIGTRKSTSIYRRSSNNENDSEVPSGDESEAREKQDGESLGALKLPSEQVEENNNEEVPMEIVVKVGEESFNENKETEVDHDLRATPTTEYEVSFSVEARTKEEAEPDLKVEEGGVETELLPSREQNRSPSKGKAAGSPKVKENKPPRSPMPHVHKCPDCGKQYSTSSNLARHRQTHRSVTDKKAKQCPHCDKIYVSMPALSMHIRTHKLGCKCHICGKCFSRPWLLQGHIRTHTGEKPFNCPLCDKSFADKSNLRAHVQTHSNVKPYVCKRCNKAFALKSYLYKHEESSCNRDGE